MSQFLNKKRKRKSKQQQPQQQCSSSSQQYPPLTITQVSSPSTSSIYAIIKTKLIKFNTDISVFRKHALSSSSPTNANNSNINNPFYNLRYYLFSKYDDGIQMDDESWYSVTPEEIATYISTCIPSSSSSTITDAFCGVGGNTIPFSTSCSHVNAIDISSSKLNMAKHNASLYACKDNITFIESDFLTTTITSDYVFLSPPWGGSAYKADTNFTLKKWITPDIEEIIKHALTLSHNLIFYLPRNTPVMELVEYLVKYDESTIKENDCTLYVGVRYLYSANKVKAMLVLYGEKFNMVTVKEIMWYVKEGRMCGKGEKEKDKRSRKCISGIARCIGGNRFLREVKVYKDNNDNNEVNVDELVKYMVDNVMDEDEIEEYKEMMMMCGKEESIAVWKEMDEKEFMECVELY